MTKREEIIPKIQSHGYWRVLIRPTMFESHRISTFSEVRNIVQSCKVSFRGWDYPFWEEGELNNVGEYVECSVDWDYYLEYCRFYRSAQFVHLFAAHEDRMDIEKALPVRYPPRPQRTGYLSTVGTTFTVTEIFEFAARLASKGVLEPTAIISIGLHNMDDHQLATFSASRFLSDHYVRQSSEPIVVDSHVSTQDLIAQTDELALSTITEIFEAFNWTNPPRHVLSEDQRRLRERRLY